MATHPDGPRRRRALESLAELRGSDLPEAFARAECAMMAVLADPSILQEELKRVDAQPLPWPLGSSGDFNNEDLPEVLRRFATEAVALFLEGHGLTEPDDPLAPRFQAVLRVCKRATDAVEAVLRPVWEKRGRRHGWRDFMNWLKRQQISVRVEAGQSVAEAAVQVGISTAAAYRVLKWKPRD